MTRDTPVRSLLAEFLGTGLLVARRGRLARWQVLVHCKRRRRPAGRQSRDVDRPARSGA